MLGNGVTTPVIAGTAVGVALLVIFATAFSFKPAMAKSDSELIAETKNLPAIQHLISKYPDASVVIDRNLEENRVEVQYQVERQLCEPNPDRFGDGCIKTLSLGVIMKQLGHPDVVASCLSPMSLTFFGDPIYFIESNECFDSVGIETDDLYVMYP